MYISDTFLLEIEANKQYISENKYKKGLSSTRMVQFVEKAIFYIDFSIAEITFLGSILR